jgi:hypothetical protein
MFKNISSLKTVYTLTHDVKIYGLYTRNATTSLLKFRFTVYNCTIEKRKRTNGIFYDIRYNATKRALKWAGQMSIPAQSYSKQQMFALNTFSNNF